MSTLFQSPYYPVDKYVLAVDWDTAAEYCSGQEDRLASWASVLPPEVDQVDQQPEMECCDQDTVSDGQSCTRWWWRW